MKTVKTVFVKDLRDQDRVSAPFLVKSAVVATGKTGKPFMTLVLQDKTGEIDARIWDQVARYSGQVTANAILQIDAQVQSYQGRLQLVIRDANLLREDEVELVELLPKSNVDPEAIYKEIVMLIESMDDIHYRALCESVFVRDETIVSLFKKAPAAKSIHHAYPSGLIEHVLSVCKILDLLARHYGDHVNRDLLLVGGLFHDLAKIWELQFEKITDYTTEGRLLGHLMMGSELIEKKSREIPDFPDEKRLLAKHMVVAHHGKLEYGSPKEPACVEALIVHMVDDLDSKVNQILKFIEADAQFGEWTALHRNFERYFYKPEWARRS